MTDLCVRQIRMAWPSGKRNSGDGIRGRTGCVYKRHVKEGGLRYGRVGRTRVCRGEHEGDSSDSVTGKNSGVPVPARHGTGCVTVCPCRSRPGMERHGGEISEGRRNIQPFQNMPWNAVLFRRAEAPAWNSTCRAAFVRTRLPVSCNAERAAAQTFR